MGTTCSCLNQTDEQAIKARKKQSQPVKEKTQDSLAPYMNPDIQVEEDPSIQLAIEKYSSNNNLHKQSTFDTYCEVLKIHDDYLRYSEDSRVTIVLDCHEVENQEKKVQEIKVVPQIGQKPLDGGSIVDNGGKNHDQQEGFTVLTKSHNHAQSNKEVNYHQDKKKEIVQSQQQNIIGQEDQMEFLENSEALQQKKFTMIQPDKLRQREVFHNPKQPQITQSNADNKLSRDINEFTLSQATESSQFNEILTRNSSLFKLDNFHKIETIKEMKETFEEDRLLLQLESSRIQKEDPKGLLTMIQSLEEERFIDGDSALQSEGQIFMEEFVDDRDDNKNKQLYGESEKQRVIKMKSKKVIIDMNDTEQRIQRIIDEDYNSLSSQSESLWEINRVVSSSYDNRNSKGPQLKAISGEVDSISYQSSQQSNLKVQKVEEPSFSLNSSNSYLQVKRIAGSTSQSQINDQSYSSSYTSAQILGDNQTQVVSGGASSNSSQTNVKNIDDTSTSARGSKSKIQKSSGRVFNQKFSKVQRKQGFDDDQKKLIQALADIAEDDDHKFSHSLGKSHNERLSGTEQDFEEEKAHSFDEDESNDFEVRVGNMNPQLIIDSDSDV